ncbi:hypothetical protein ACVQK1_09235 [Edwardsiella tarda]
MNIYDCDVYGFKTEMVNAIRCSISSMLIGGLDDHCIVEVVVEFLSPLSQLGTSDKEILDMLNDASGSSSDVDSVIDMLISEFGG